ncbi:MULTISPECIES: hypothetical protein [Aerosakkonema]|uniref:hypothetical protein n=1 Tax=Aerosakkonema TaxID=1246629 RepID=UPI0035BB1E2A
MNAINQPILSETKSKSIFASKTFWAAALTAVAAIAPIVGEAVKEKKITVDRTVNIVIILATTGATLAGRVQAENSVYTPNWLPGPNKSDLETSNS